MTTARSIASASLLLGLAALTGGCKSGSDDPTVEALDENQVTATLRTLQKTESCGDVRQYLEEAWLANITQGGYPICGDCIALGEPVLVDDVAGGAADAAAPEPSASPDSVSDTNTQEAGVDEADLVETDREGRIYTGINNTLSIVAAFPPGQMAIVGQLDLNTAISGLYLDEPNQRIVVIGQRYPVYALAESDGAALADTAVIGPWPEPTTELIFIDVANVETPTITSRLSIPGFQIATRRIDDRIHLVSQQRLDLPQPLRDDSELMTLQTQYWNLLWTANDKTQLDQLEAQIRAVIHDALADFDVQAYLPQQVVQNSAGEVTEAMLSCADIYAPEVAIRSPELLTLTSIGSDGSRAQSVAVVSQGGVVYATLDHLYITQPSYGWWLAGDDAERSAIHRFAISGAAPQYLSSGVVSGVVSSPFNMSEHDGYLRVATTESRWNADNWQQRQLNHLAVLADAGDGRLSLVAPVIDFAEGETIRSSRFLGDRGFVVTFRQIDPLFAFDFSDPTAPQLRGELEIPGFSTYMHPIDENHLLTIGWAGTATGATNQLQLQIFDVSDLDNPRQMQSHIPNLGDAAYSWSEAGYDHHAFTYYAPARALAIPMSYSDWGSGDYFNGVIAFSIDPESGISELSRVDHNDLAMQTYCTEVQPLPAWLDQACTGDEAQLAWLARLRRSVMMTSNEQTLLYSVSNVGIKATDLRAAEPVLGSALLPLPAHETMWVAY